MAETSKNNSNMNATGAGIAGAVIGAGVGIAATKIMSDEKLRNKVKDSLMSAKDQVLETVDQMTENRDGQKVVGEVKSNLKTLKKAQS